MVSDAALLEQYVRARDADALAELYRRYADLVYGTCLRVTQNSDDAEDVAQECFLELARKADSITSSLPAWLHKLARSRSIDAMRKASTRRRYEEQAVIQRDDDAELTWAQIAPHVDQALAELPHHLRVPIMLHYLQGRSQSEVAIELGINQSTVSRLLEKALTELRERLKAAGVVPSVAALAALLSENAATAAPGTLIACLAKMAIAGVGKTGTAVGTALSAGATGTSSVLSTAFLGTLYGKIAVGVAVIAIAVVGGIAVRHRDRLARRQTDKMEAKAAAMMVPMKVEYAPARLSWVAATTTCLRALGVECDHAEVAGMTGHAFHLGVHPELCPSGPFAWDWDALCRGVHFLGRNTQHFRHPEESTRAHRRAAFEFAKREIEAGRPCVWAPDRQEFAVVVGIQNDAYIVRRFKEDPRPVPFDEVEAPVYVLAFPTPTKLSRGEGDRHAVANAVEMFNTGPYDEYRYGAAGYDLWMQVLSDRTGDAFGNSYYAACYAEGREFARTFVARLAKRNDFAAEPLNQAAQAYGEATEAMNRVAKLFPGPAEYGQKVEDANAIAEAVEALRAAKDAECRAMELLGEVAAMDWPKGELP